MTAPTIVCGVDRSDNASAAVDFAHILSEWLEGRLVLVHVAQLPLVPGASLVPGSYEELGDMVREEGGELLDVISADHRFPRGVERVVEVGDPVDKLVTVAEREDADLIVVGAPARRRILSALLGSVTTGLLGHAPCPVTVVSATASGIPAGSPAVVRAIGLGERRPSRGRERAHS